MSTKDLDNANVPDKNNSREDAESISIGNIVRGGQNVIAIEGSEVRGIRHVANDNFSFLGYDRHIEERLDVHFPKRSSTYFSVTEAEIETYAQFGLLSTIFLTLFGALVGFALGCIVALIQGNLPAPSQMLLQWLAAIMGILSVIFLSAALYLVSLQKKNKKAWESSDNPSAS